MRRRVVTTDHHRIVQHGKRWEARESGPFPIHPQPFDVPWAVVKDLIRAGARVEEIEDGPMP